MRNAILALELLSWSFSFGRRETDAQENKQCACRPVEDLRKCSAASESVAEQRREPREAQAPKGACGREAEAKRDKRSELGGTISSDELRHKGEEEKCDLGIQNIGQQTLPIDRKKTGRR